MEGLRNVDGSSGKTIAQLLDDNKCLIETEDLNETHSKSLKRYEHMLTQCGKVYVGSGVGQNRSGERYSRNRFFFKDNASPKVVVDFEGLYNDSSSSGKRDSEDKIIHQRILQKRIKLPIHTYGDAFHLEEHIWITIHVDYLEPYKFKGKELMEKLVLSEQDKDLIKILMEMSKMKIDDIIEGKSGGSFVMATGVPGTGKTLTAEVFSETIEKPLYKVQCSQLGLNVEQVEKNLKQVLSRASRWGAILLIDEADVYVRARGNDINQNAIVGTFLRTLEYYTGILFMTSNMETAIDDAIMSRATAHLQYAKPDENSRTAIWKILSEQFGISFNENEIKELGKHFGDAVGRDIKALLKLAKMYAEGKQVECTVQLIKDISGFVPNVGKELQ